MDFIMLLATVLFVSTSVWLWRFAMAQMIMLSLDTSLAPNQNIAASQMPNLGWYRSILNVIKKLYRNKVYLLLKTFPFIIFIGGNIYFLIFKGHLWMSSSNSILSLLAFSILAFVPNPFKDRKQDRKIADLELKTFKKYKEEETVRYVGQAMLPKKVYEEDSHNITVNLKPSFNMPSKDHNKFCVRDNKSGKSFVIQIVKNSRLKQFIEIELLAAGFEIDGEKKQQQSFSMKTLSYCWNCYFPNSGNHTLSLIIRLLSPSKAIEVGAIQHSIKVAKLDNLTKRQVWLIASLAGLVSGGLTIAEVFRRLGLW